MKEFDEWFNDNFGDADVMYPSDNLWDKPYFIQNAYFEQFLLTKDYHVLKEHVKDEGFLYTIGKVYGGIFHTEVFINLKLFNPQWKNAEEIYNKSLRDIIKLLN